MSEHELLVSHRKVEIGSERSFGIVFAIVLGLIGAWPALRGGEPRLWLLALASAFIATAILIPIILRPFNYLWFRFGLALNKIMSPIVLGLIFYGAFLPIGLVLRAVGKNLLRLKREPEEGSYWSDRQSPEHQPGSMSRQF